VSTLLIGILGSLSIYVMCQSLIYLFKIKRSEVPIFSWYQFLILVIVYVIFITGFAILYLGLGMLGYKSVSIQTIHYNEVNSLSYIANLIYFSAMTMLSVGYGDIIPAGIGKLLVIIQALIGYLLPAAFVVSGFVSPGERDRS
jgi:potassium channel LctB